MHASDERTANFTVAPPPLGKESLRISVSGFSFEFRGLDDRSRGVISRIYRFFIEERDSAAVPVQVGRMRGAAPVQGVDFEMAAFEGFSCLLAPYFAAARREDLSSCFLHLLNEDEGSLIFAFENFLRWMVSRMALEKSGLLLHASAKAIEGQAHVFLGAHESGKSTAVALITEGTTIADDVLLVLPGNLGYIAATMPAATKFEQRMEDIGFYQVAGFYKLNKAGENSVKRVPKAAAFAALVSSCPFQREFNKHLYIIRNMIERVPVFDLNFKKEEGFFGEALLRKG